MLCNKYKVTPLRLNLADPNDVKLYVHKVQCELVNDQIIWIRDDDLDTESSATPELTMYIFDRLEQAIEFCKFVDLPYITDQDYKRSKIEEENQRLWIDEIVRG